jgi:hypothetical protein
MTDDQNDDDFDWKQWFLDLPDDYEIIVPDRGFLPENFVWTPRHNWVNRLTNEPAYPTEQNLLDEFTVVRIALELATQDLFRNEPDDAATPYEVWVKYMRAAIAIVSKERVGGVDDDHDHDGYNDD